MQGCSSIKDARDEMPLLRCNAKCSLDKASHLTGSCSQGRGTASPAHLPGTAQAEAFLFWCRRKLPSSCFWVSRGLNVLWVQNGFDPRYHDLVGKAGPRSVGFGLPELVEAVNEQDSGFVLPEEPADLQGGCEGTGVGPHATQWEDTLLALGVGSLSTCLSRTALSDSPRARRTCVLVPLSGAHLLAPVCSFGVSEAALPRPISPGLPCGTVTHGTELPAQHLSFTLHSEALSGAEGLWEAQAETPPSLWH